MVITVGLLDQNDELTYEDIARFDNSKLVEKQGRKAEGLRFE